MSIWWMLKDGKPVPVDGFDVEFAKWYEDFSNRQTARTEVQDPRDGTKVLISTVFLALDHGWDDGPPVLWETMIFGGSLDGEQWRYRSEAEARVGHEAAVTQVQESFMPLGSPASSAGSPDPLPPHPDSSSHSEEPPEQGLESEGR